GDSRGTRDGARAVGGGGGGFRSALAVARGPRRRPRAVGPDLEHAVAIGPRDGPATGTDRGHVDRRHDDREVAHGVLGRETRLARPAPPPRARGPPTRRGQHAAARLV